ncbi:MAG TPA: 16S rRNA (cytosine(1402)-N(4))-methyltransferase RsmH [Desulfomonilia bacterium]
MRHVTVLLKEVVQVIAPRDGGKYFDGTLGGGGHSLAILEASSPSGMLAGTDLDGDALSRLSETFKPFGERAHFFRDNFTSIDTICKTLGWNSLSGIVLDLGVSSFQLDMPEKGFSFSKDAPLDMRFESGAELSAYDVVNGYDEEELARIIREYGEERFSRRIAEKITDSRPVKTTKELAGIIASAIPRKYWPANIHPATRTFQAIRIEVNRELDNLREFLPKAASLLEPGGVMAVISFHSLEDRIVKRFFAGPVHDVSARGIPVLIEPDTPVMERVTKKPVLPSPMEIEANPRSRSAKLRAARRRG